MTELHEVVLLTTLVSFVTIVVVFIKYDMDTISNWLFNEPNSQD